MGKRIKILVVDDESNIVSSMKEILEMLGDFDIFVAENGEQGLRSIKKNNPEVVFTDVDMPKMDGIEMIRQAWEEERETKVFMMSGRPTSEIEEFIHRFPEVIFLMKPFGVRKIKSLIDQF